MTCLASGIVLYRHAPEGTRQLVLRNRLRGQWGFAKGRRSTRDEHEVHTAVREVAEETGFTGLALHPGFRREIEYHVAEADGVRRPKRVVYFLAEAPPHDPVLSPEHDALRWIGASEIAEHLEHEALHGIADAALDVAARRTP
ncbi:MAG: NUDIX domain-containing protein [Planctomycetota bacterium]|jgi:8-oxo-dGTP pyrophosphatase MutT (NUDIX family)